MPSPKGGSPKSMYTRVETEDLDSDDRGSPAGQLGHISWTRLLFFSFLNPLLKKGFASPLQEDDLYDLSDINTPNVNHEKFEKQWARVQGQSRPLWRGILRVNWLPFVVCGFLQLMSVSLKFSSPMMLQAMVLLIQGDDADGAWKGFVISGAMLCLSLSQTLVETHYNYKMNQIGIRARGALMTKVHNKAVRLSEPAFQRIGVGKIVNLVQIDCSELITSVISLTAFPCVFTADCQLS